MIALYAPNNDVTYFDSFGVENIPKEIKTFINKSIIVTTIFRIQAYDSILCEYLCIIFIDFMLGENMFSPKALKKYVRILKYFTTNV